MILFVFLGLCLIALCLAGGYLVKISLYPQIETYEHAYNREIAAGYYNEDFFETLTKDQITIKSEFGYDLYGYWIKNGKSKKTVILIHGFTVNLMASLRYVNIFLDQGFNVLIYDEPYHGKSGGKYCTMGYNEKFDLRSCVSWVIDTCGKDSIVGVHGESMGASTAIMHASIDERTAFVISDCAYEDVYKQFCYQLKSLYKLPPFPVLTLANFFNKIKTGHKYREISPIWDVEKINIPILFIHGDSDTFTLCSNTENLYRKKTGKKELYIARGANHAESFLVNREKYIEVVRDFIKSISMEGYINEK